MDEPPDVVWVARQQPVARLAYGHERGIHGIACTSATKQHTALAAETFVHRPDVDAVQESREFDLPTQRIAPYLRDDGAGRAYLQAFSPSRTQTEDHPPIATVHSDEDARV
ncbi:MAG TPA: hypothetical protein VFS62_00165 [Chloroflexota bacterium]|nr:hypothetical protein [Chloroflexota bacterium]